MNTLFLHPIQKGEADRASFGIQARLIKARPGAQIREFNVFLDSRDDVEDVLAALGVWLDWLEERDRVGELRPD